MSARRKAVQMVALQDLEPEVMVRPMMTTDDAIDRYLGDLARRGYSGRTRDTYRRTLNKFADTLPRDWDVKDIRPVDVMRFLDGWNHLSAATRAQTFSVLAGLFDWLHRSEKIKRSPMDRMNRPMRKRPEDVDVVTVSSADVPKLLAAAEGWAERLALAVLAYLGPRRHAVAQLRLTDYDQAGRRLRFREKGGKTIWKPVPHELAQTLDAAIAAGVYEQDDSYLIPSRSPQRKQGERDDRIIWRLVNQAAARAEIRVTVHAIRAAFAVYYLERNPGEIESLKELLGHRSILTTQTYLRRLNRGAAMERGS